MVHHHQRSTWVPGPGSERLSIRYVVVSPHARLRSTIAPVEADAHSPARAGRAVFWTRAGHPHCVDAPQRLEGTWGMEYGRRREHSTERGEGSGTSSVTLLSLLFRFHTPPAGAAVLAIQAPFHSGLCCPRASARRDEAAGEGKKSGARRE